MTFHTASAKGNSSSTSRRPSVSGAVKRSRKSCTWPERGNGSCSPGSNTSPRLAPMVHTRPRWLRCRCAPRGQGLSWISSCLGSQDSAHRGAADLHTAGGLRFADAGARIIFLDFRAWPKTLRDFGLSDARFTAILEWCSRMAAVDPFRPARIHSITRLWVWRAGPTLRGSSRASTRMDVASTPRSASATRSDSRTDWPRSARRCGSGS